MKDRYALYDEYGLRHSPCHLLRVGRWRVLGKLLADFEFLETKVGRLDIDALLADLRAAVRLPPPESEHLSDLLGTLHMLDREAHNLRDWDWEQRPALFAQQVYNRAVDMRLAHLIAGAAARLAQLGQPYLKVVWHVGPESPELGRTLTGHSEGVRAVAVTPDGRRAVSTSKDGTLRVWDLQTGQNELTLTGHSEDVRAVAVTPDGRRAVSASQDRTLKMWDLQTGQEEHTLSGHSDGVFGVAVTPDGRWTVSASFDRTLRVWNLQKGRKGLPSPAIVIECMP